jgi:hypothetical protein
MACHDVMPNFDDNATSMTIVNTNDAYFSPMHQHLRCPMHFIFGGYGIKLRVMHIFQHKQIIWNDIIKDIIKYNTPPILPFLAIRTTTNTSRDPSPPLICTPKNSLHNSWVGL